MTQPSPPPEPRPDLYQVLDELDRLEELLEDMADLGVSSRAAAEARMRALNELIDEIEDTAAGSPADRRHRK